MNKQNDKECINNILWEITDDMGSASIRIINSIIDDLGDEEKEFVNNTMKKHPRFNPIYHYVYGRLSYKTYRIEPEFFGNEMVDGIRRIIRSYISE